MWSAARLLSGGAGPHLATYGTGADTRLMQSDGGGSAVPSDYWSAESWRKWADPRRFSEDFLVSVGVVLGILASFLTCFGLAIQKTSLCHPSNANVNPWRQPRWIVGLVSIVIGNVLDFVAFGLAPASLLSPLAALSLVWNLFVSSALLGETYDRNDVCSSLLIFLGTGITVVYSSHHEKEYTLEALRQLYRQPRMVWYGILTPTVLGAHYFMANASEGKQGTSWRLIGLVGWCGFAGIMGGQSVLFAKSVVELLKDAFNGDDVFMHPETYLLIVLLISSLLTQITFLNNAMKRYDQLHVLVSRAARASCYRAAPRAPLTPPPPPLRAQPRKRNEIKARLPSKSRAARSPPARRRAEH
jgi:drug/metabolite transporter (DMT)-like permease